LPTFAVLLPHAQVALTADHNGMMRVASYLGESGNSMAARELWRGILEERTRALGPKHPQTLATCSDLAYWMGSTGDMAGARDRFGALLPIAERVLGPEHSDTLSIRANLARGTGVAEDAVGGGTGCARVTGHGGA
jgi:hypothetical protein